MVRKSKEASAKKMIHKSEHIVISSAGKVVRRGAQTHLSGARVSEDAAKIAAGAAGKMLALIGTQVQTLLQLLNRKTVRPEDLLHCVNTGTCGFSGAAEAIRNGSHAVKQKGSKPNHMPISMESAYKAFCDGFGDKARITEQARICLSYLAEEYLELLGDKAIGYSAVAKRNTLKDRDVIAALGCVDPHHV
jgi:histone H3/H4